jgi:hypothetical protein
MEFAFFSKNAHQLDTVEAMKCGMIVDQLKAAKQLATTLT